MERIIYSLRSRNATTCRTTFGSTPKQVVKSLKAEADHIETITSPSTSSFKSVGQYHQDFTEVTDQQVIDILRTKE